MSRSGVFLDNISTGIWRIGHAARCHIRIKKSLCRINPVSEDPDLAIAEPYSITKRLMALRQRKPNIKKASSAA